MSEIEALSFEEAFRELETTVARLEAGDLSLEESLALFERGMALAARCEAQLDQAEQRVQQLAVRPNGRIETVPFEEL